MRATPSTQLRRTLAATCITTVAFFFSAFGTSCKNKSKDNPEEVVVPLEDSGAGAEVPELDPDSYNAKRAQAFGFLSRMPASTEGALALRNFSALYSGIINSNTFKQAERMLPPGAIEPDSLAQGQVLVDEWVGKEVFLIFGQGSAPQFRNLGTLTELFRELVFQSAAAQMDEEADPTQAVMQVQVEIRKQLLDEGSELSKAIDSLQMMPIVLGSKVGDSGANVIQALEQMQENLPPIVVASDFELAGGKFRSWKVNLQDVVHAGYEAELNEFLQDEAASKRIADSLRTKTVEVVFGQIDDYLVIAAGPDRKHLQFVSRPEESILATKAFGFSDQFLDKKWLAYSFMSKALLAPGAAKGQIAKTGAAFADGLKEMDGTVRKLGPLAEKLTASLEKLAAREAQTHVGVAFMEDGIRGESIGGYTAAALDAGANNLFANAAPEDAAFVLSMATNPEMRPSWIELAETFISFVNVSGEIFALRSGLGADENPLNQMKAMTGDSLPKIWGILKSKTLEGLGSQGAVIVDLKGGMPKGIPGTSIPNVIINEGKIPRITLASDVADRSKLAESWAEIVPIANETLAAIPGQEPGNEAQLPDVMSDSGGGLETHYFSLPFLSNDFLPSLSINDELFFLSSSKLFAQEIAKAEKGGDIKGAYMKINFAAIQEFGVGWVNLLEANSELIFPDENARADFERGLPQIKQGLGLMGALRSLEYNRYSEGSGAWRSSWHLEVKDSSN